VKKESKVNVTVTNNYSNFKCRLPLEWLELLNINQDDKEINLTYIENKLYVRKPRANKFRELSITEKSLQMKKFELLYGYKYSPKKDLLNMMEEYFNISYRTAYRCLKENVDLEKLKKVELIEKQEKNSRNINVMFVKNKQSIMPIITIPTNLAILLLEGKPYEELGIKSAYEIYKKNLSRPILMELDEINKCIIITR
jgi:hypothetical protein